MIETGAQLASWDHLRRHPEQKGFVGFGGLNETRFRGQVEPGQRLVFVARETRVRSRMFLYAVQAFVANELVLRDRSHRRRDLEPAHRALAHDESGSHELARDVAAMRT
jgi:3-hydroxymyristoyl/3-hydroxydecanoyl-(acyl carrier protein) dehydratase